MPEQNPPPPQKAGQLKPWNDQAQARAAKLQPGDQARVVARVIPTVRQMLQATTTKEDDE
jgi:hypothetical protein